MDMSLLYFIVAAIIVAWLCVSLLIASDEIATITKDRNHWRREARRARRRADLLDRELDDMMQIYTGKTDEIEQRRLVEEARRIIDRK